MNLNVIEGNITQVVERGVIGHVVNNQGIMGAGVARALYTRWPAVRERYINLNEGYSLGKVQEVDVTEPGLHDLVVLNMIAQTGLGGSRDNIDYMALEYCIKTVRLYAKNRSLPVYFPFGMGAGLAGGDWDVITKMIEQHCPNATLVKLR